jgi:hypothetical protein
MSPEAAATPEAVATTEAASARVPEPLEVASAPTPLIAPPSREPRADD